MDEAPRRRLTRLQLAVVGGAAALVIAVGVVVVPMRDGSSADVATKATTTTTEPSPVVALSAQSTTTSVAPVPPPPLGTQLATLRIPKIGVDQPVVEGTGADQLAGATGHYTGTALPGAHGNVGIAGHRTTHGAPFNRLDELVPGDQLVLTVNGVDLQYSVSGSQVVKPTDVSVLTDKGDDRVTLTTCHPKHSARTRLIITAVRVPAMSGQLRGY